MKPANDNDTFVSITQRLDFIIDYDERPTRILIGMEWAADLAKEAETGDTYIDCPNVYRGVRLTVVKDPFMMTPVYE